MRTITVNFKIVTSAPGDEPLAPVIAHALTQLAQQADVYQCGLENGQEFTFTYTSPQKRDVFIYSSVDGREQIRESLINIPEQTFEANVTTTYDITYSE